MYKFDIQFHLNFSCAIIEYLTAFVPDALVDAIPPKLASAPGSKHEINQLKKKKKEIMI